MGSSHGNNDVRFPTIQSRGGKVPDSRGSGLGGISSIPKYGQSYGNAGGSGGVGQSGVYN